MLYVIELRSLLIVLRIKIKYSFPLRAQWPLATYLCTAGSSAYLQKFNKVKIYKTTYWYVCYDHKNTVWRREHLKWLREWEFVKNMKNYENF